MVLDNGHWRIFFSDRINLLAFSFAGCRGDRFDGVAYLTSSFAGIGCPDKRGWNAVRVGRRGVTFAEGLKVRKG